MSYIFEASYLLGALFFASMITAMHAFVQSMLCRLAVRRLYAIQDEMGELCRGIATPDTNRQMDELAHEAARLLARFDIDYWAALDRQPSRNKDREERR
ncbi:MAG: hypothetical protein MI757_04315 [Pirellulales bacterium]|nr:hypothetical protein [Pirellulales bacterium]